MSRKKHIAEFVRMPKTVEMAIADLKFDETRPKDERFIGLYKKYLTGKLKDIRTRVDIGKVVPGFFKLPSRDHTKTSGYNTTSATLIRKYRVFDGDSSLNFLYKAFVGPETNKLICSDDLLSFHAYKKLGIRYVQSV